MSAAIISLAAARAVQSESGHAEDLAEALGQVRKLTAKRERLMAEPKGEELSAPGCKIGCARCFRECAVTGVILHWWSGELAKLTGAGGTVH